MAPRYIDRKAIGRAANKLKADNEAWIRRRRGARGELRVVQTHRVLQAR